MPNQDSSEDGKVVHDDDFDTHHSAVNEHSHSKSSKNVSKKQSNTKDKLGKKSRKSKSHFILLNCFAKNTNIPKSFTVLSQLLTSSGYFWCLVAACTLVEPILCSYFPEGSILLAQKIVLSVSTVLFVIQLVGVAATEWETILSMQSGVDSEVFAQKVNQMTLFKILVFFTAEGEYIWEFTCLAIGWIFIFTRPGIAILRCFRVFRLLWFYELAGFRRTMYRWFDPLFGRPFVHRLFHVLKFAVRALSALGNEMFRLTTATRGGLLLMAVFFFCAYVIGAALWVESGTSNNYCATLGECMYTMIRLTLFDGNGFDYAFSLTEHHMFMFYIVMLYMCITSFGILNGLVGLFGHAFKLASEESFHESSHKKLPHNDEELDYQEFKDFDSSSLHRRNHNSRGDYSNPSTRPAGNDDSKASFPSKKKPESGKMRKVVHSLMANRLAMHLKLHKVASTHLIRKYHSAKTPPIPTGIPEMAANNEPKVYPSPRVEHVETPSTHKSLELHEHAKQTLQMVGSMHSHLQHLHGKLESQSNVVVDIFQKMNDLYRHMEQHQQVFRESSERHEHQLEQLQSKVVFVQNNAPPDFEPPQAYEQPYPVYLQGGGGGVRSVGRGFQQSDSLPSPSRVQTDGAFGIDTVLDGNDSPRSQITFDGDLVSVHSDAQEPQPSTRAFNSRASLMSRKVPSQKLKPIEWNKQGSSASLLSYDYMPQSVRSKLATMHQVIHSTEFD